MRRLGSMTTSIELKQGGLKSWDPDRNDGMLLAKILALTVIHSVFNSKSLNLETHKTRDGSRVF